jgi:hypothetical protein
MDKREEHKVTTTDAEIKAALAKASLLANEPLARTVTYISVQQLLIIELSNGRRLALPIEDIQGMAGATKEQIKRYELLGKGTGIRFPDLNVDLYVPALVEGVYGNRRWMAQLGEKGGRAKTAAKRLASQTNGAKGGRPKKTLDATF